MAGFVALGVRSGRLKNVKGVEAPGVGLGVTAAIGNPVGDEDGPALSASGATVLLVPSLEAVSDIGVACGFGVENRVDDVVDVCRLVHPFDCAGQGVEGDEGVLVMAQVVRSHSGSRSSCEQFGPGHGARRIQDYGSDLSLCDALDADDVGVGGEISFVKSVFEGGFKVEFIEAWVEWDLGDDFGAKTLSADADGGADDG